MKYVVRVGIICSCALACILSVALVAEGLWFVRHTQMYPVMFRLNDWPVPTYLYSTLLILVGLFVFATGSFVFNRVTSGQYFRIKLRGVITLFVVVVCGLATLSIYHEWLGRLKVRGMLESGESEDGPTTLIDDSRRPTRHGHRVKSRSATFWSRLTAKQPVVELNATEETVAVVNQASRVQVTLQDVKVRLWAMMKM